MAAAPIVRITKVLRRARGPQGMPVAEPHMSYIERLSSQEPADSTYRTRSPTAFQQYLDENELPRPRWWRQGQ